jgi:hypothetical protein
MDLLQDQTDIPADQMMFIFAGKRLERGRTLSDYSIYDGCNIDMILRLRGGRSALTGLVEGISENSAFPTDEEADQRVKGWRKLAEKGDFDAEVHILDPHAYYAMCESAEQKVVLRSQWLRQGGDLAGFGSETWAMIYDLESMPMIPFWIRTLAKGLTTSEGPLANRTLTTLCELYRTVFGLIESLDMLKEQQLCTTYYNILIERNQGTIAELVQIRVENLTDFLGGLEVAMTFASKQEAVDAEEESDMLMQCLLALVEPMLSLLGSTELLFLVTSLDEGLNICRMLVYLLDLGLVFYAGSHASTLDMVASDQEINGMGLDLHNALNFTCSKRPLACLGGFIDAKSVWTFRLGERAAAPKTGKILYPHDDRCPRRCLGSSMGGGKRYSYCWRATEDQEIPCFERVHPTRSESNII